MAIKKEEFLKLKVMDRIIFDSQDEHSVGGFVSKIMRDGGVVILWDDGAKSLPFYADETGSYVDWWLPNGLRNIISGVVGS